MDVPATEAIRNRLALARRQLWEGSLCSDARSVVSSSHACTYCLGACYGRQSRAALPPWTSPGSAAGTRRTSVC
jgi:hypothetical protein